MLLRQVGESRLEVMSTVTSCSKAVLSNVRLRSLHDQSPSHVCAVDLPTRRKAPRALGAPTVYAMELCGNRRPRVEGLVSAWNQGICEDADPVGESDDSLIGASAEPNRRPRTRLTDEEVGAIRTARAQGDSVIVLAHQFGVHRGTVWVKTREMSAPAPLEPSRTTDMRGRHHRLT